MKHRQLFCMFFLFSVGLCVDAVFNYNPKIHNVVAVSRAGYNGCNTPKGSKVYLTGKDRIKLVKGQNFFICNIAGHCESGMKIAVNAV